MAESHTSKKLALPKGEQRKLFLSFFEKTSIEKASRVCDVSTRTLRAWRSEEYLCDEECVRRLCKETGVAFPARAHIRERFWYTKKAAIKGRSVVLKKYGRMPVDERARQEGWERWWKEKGRSQENSILYKRLPIQKPRRSSLLAEFCGMMLGDGGISKRQVVMTLHKYDDAEYAVFAKSIFKKLFCIDPSVYNKGSSKAVDVVVSRTALADYCVEVLGLVRGNKVKKSIDIPEWIKKNTNYALACVRGLMDTDGTVIRHRYKVRGQIYLYKKLAFTSASLPLRKSVFSVLQGQHIDCRLTANDVRIDSIDAVRKYFRIVKTHNPKHLNRYKN